MSEVSKYEKISEVIRTEYTDKSNLYLKLGWILLNVESVQYSSHGWRASFVLGWLRENGEAKHPEKTAREKALEEAAKDDSLPF